MDKILKTNAKRAILATSLVASLLVSAPTVAYASVPAENVIGDLQTTEDRTQIKKDDKTNIENRFNTGTMSLSEVEQAIELSNLLNGYYFDVLNYTNTNVSELTSIDIVNLYYNYCIARDTDNIPSFCLNNLYNKPACDGFITLSSRSVANEIRSSIASRVINNYVEKGYNVSSTYKVVATDTELYCVVKVNGTLRKVVITGPNTEDIINTLAYLDNLYRTAVNNIGGKSTSNDGTFMYNGIDKYTGSSVYLSLPDSDKKDTILHGVTMARELLDGEKITVDVSTEYYGTLTSQEKKDLKALGYTSKSVSSATKTYLTLDKNINKVLTK